MSVPKGIGRCTQGLFRPLPQRNQNVGRNLNRVTFTRRGLQRNGRLRQKPVRQRTGAIQVGQTAAHPTLNGHHHVRGIPRLLLERSRTHRRTAVGPIPDCGGQQRPSCLIQNHFGKARTHGGDEGVGRTEIDTDREPMLVRRARLTRFSDLKECHGLTERKFCSVDVFSKALNKHPLTNSGDSGGPVALLVDR